LSHALGREEKISKQPNCRTRSHEYRVLLKKQWLFILDNSLVLGAVAVVVVLKWW